MKANPKPKIISKFDQRRLATSMALDKFGRALRSAADIEMYELVEEAVTDNVFVDGVYKELSKQKDRTVKPKRPCGSKKRGWW
jgi:hypothetical protein